MAPRVLRAVVAGWAVLFFGSTMMRATERQDCIDYGDFLHLKSLVATPGQGEQVAVSGRFAYLADSLGLRVIDITDPEDPAIIGSLDIPIGGFNLAVSENHAYVAAGSGGLQVIDVSDPAAPFIVSSVGLSAGAVTVSGNYAYVTDNSFLGLRVVDVTDPTAPFIDGSVELRDVVRLSDVEVSESHAYVAAGGSSYLQVIDVTNPSAPVIVGAVDHGGFGHTVAVSGGHAYVGGDAIGGNGQSIQVVDVSNPAAPLPVGSILFDEIILSNQDIALSGHFAYAALGGGIGVIDVADPVFPRLVGIVDESRFDGESGVAVSGEHLYVASDFGLKVYRGSSAGLAPLAGSVDTSSTRNVAVSGNHAYLAASLSGLQVVDITDSSVPVPAGSVDTPDFAADLAVSGSHAYVADRFGGLQVIDITDPVAPFIAASVETGFRAEAVALSGSFAFVAARDDGVQVIDITDPLVPFIGGSVEIPGQAIGVTISDTHAYVPSIGDFNGLHVIDISSTTSPVLAGSVPADVHINSGVAVSGRHAYVGVTSGLQVIDISYPAAPIITGLAHLPTRASDVLVSGRHAYVTIGLGGLWVIDITNPAAPLRVGSTPVHGAASGLALSNDLLYVAASSDPLLNEVGGLRVARLACTPPIEVSVDIKPGGESNAIDCGARRGIVPVAILSTDDFDATFVDHTTVTFGPHEAMETHENRHGLARHEEDVEGDGDIDLVFHFRFNETGIACGDDHAELRGRTYNGQEVTGSDIILAVPNKSRRWSVAGKINP